MSDKITKREAFNYLKKLTLPTVSSYFMASGMILILTAVPGAMEHLTAIAAILVGRDFESPQSDFGWVPGLGIGLFIIGSAIKLKFYYANSNNDLLEKRTWLKENYGTLSDARLQDEFEKLWFIKGASFRAIKHLLGHPENKNAVLNLFDKCHTNVLANNDWFEFKGRFLKIRFQMGYPISILSFILMFMTGLILGTAEYLQPGSTNSGPYALYGYGIYCTLSVLGGLLVHREFQSLGSAITLVEEYSPTSENNQQ